MSEKEFWARLFENGCNAYLVQLPGFQTMLGTNRYLMDEVTGQFYAVYHNSYKQMLTRPRLHQLRDQGELLAELAATRHHFGYE